jgi:PiT family inorganic phosphate transporter
LNDTPKIAALALIVPGLAPSGGVALAAAAIAAGGLIGARRVAETMSHKITKLDHEEGFASNLATGVLVILAGGFGLPVSTTHVSVGSLFGIGAVTGQLNMRTMAGVALSWLVTLPCAAACAGTVYFLSQKAAL